MKKILVAVTTVNGYLANNSEQYPWASEADKKEFDKLYEKAGCIIIGRRTYDILKSRPSFPTPGKFVVVVSHNANLTDDRNNIIFAQSPQEAIAQLESRRFVTALIGGGGELNSSFMKAQLVDEIVLTIEPFVISQGTLLFASSNFDSKLAYMETKKLSKQTIQLRYKVLHNHTFASYA